jgi:agmatine deiminase
MAVSNALDPAALPCGNLCYNQSMRNAIIKTRKRAAEPSQARVACDWETTKVTFAPDIDVRYYADVDAVLFEFIRTVREHDDVELIEDRRLDIWIRDYAPLSCLDGRAIKFKFSPDYAPRTYSQAIDDAIRRHLKIDVSSDITLDGGNFTTNGKVAICTTKLCEGNRKGVENNFCSLLGLESVIVLAYPPEDKTGHIDGMARFIDAKTLAVDALSLPYLDEREIEDKGIDIVTCPGVDCGYALDGFLSAAGCYVNFLQTKNAIYVPQFGLDEDMEAMEFFSKFAKPAIPVRCEQLAKYGGCLNCVSWNHV